MNENPYAPPLPLGGSDQFYTDDITLLPTTAIWRAVRRQSLVAGVLLYPYFVARKALRLRHRANYGISRVAELPAVPENQLPQHVKEAFAPLAEVCRSYQMQHVRCIRSPCIGNKTAYASLWLDPTGKTNCSIVWIDIRLGAFRRSKTLFACGSWLQSGVELHTAPIAPADWIPELVPPNREMLPLAEHTSAAETIDRHRQRIADRSEVRTFDAYSLLEETVRNSQELFDHFVARGFYAPLSEAEVKRLVSINLAPPF